MHPIDTVTAALDRVITDALRQSYTSRSSVNEIPTGNAYQSVRVGTDVLPGFRTRREALFSRLDFADKTVIDIGANLGENARLSAERGARRVYALEYDRLFSLISSLICARNGADNVFNINADASTYTFDQMHLDVALAFSVWPYMSGRIDHLCDVGVRCLVLETHNVNSAEQIGPYLEAVTRRLPFYTVLEATDWGKNLSGVRYVLIFGDTWKTVASICSLRRQWNPSRQLYSKFDFDAVRIEAESSADSKVDLSTGGITDFRYWRNFLKGVNDYRTSRVVRSDNIYVKELIGLLSRPTFDPGFASELIDLDKLIAIVRRRFDDFLAMEMDRSVNVDPIVLYVPYEKMLAMLQTSEPDLSLTRLEGSGEYWLDGYHRLFSACFHKIHDHNLAIRFHFTETNVW